MAIAERGPVPIPPPLLYLAAFLAGIALDRLWPLALLPRGWDYALGAIRVDASIALMPSVGGASVIEPRMPPTRQ